MHNIIFKYTNEFSPDNNSIGWVNFYGTRIMKSNISYQINNKLLSYLHKLCNKKNVKLIDIQNKYSDIGIIYCINNINGQSYIGHTNIPLILLLKYNICSTLLGKNSVFDYFYDDQLANFSFKILEFVYFDDFAQLEERKIFLETLYLETDNDIKKNMKNKYLSLSTDRLMDEDKFYAKRIKILHDIYTRFTKLHYIYINIYKLVNNTNGKVYITGDTRKLSKDQIFYILTQKNNILADDLKIFADYFDFTNLECCKVKTMVEYKLRLDYHMITNNSVTEGYNKSYLLDESLIMFNDKLISSAKKKITKNLFLKINIDLIDKKIVDVGNYKNIYGMVYMIERISTKEKYFGISYHTTLKQTIINKYRYAIQNTIKHDKLLKIFMQIPFDSFNFQIICIKYENDYSTDLQEQLKKYIKKFDAINNGYNIDRKNKKSFIQ